MTDIRSDGKQSQVQNGTRIPLAFHVDLPDGLREVFSVSPAGGRLKGKESREIQVTSKGREAQHGREGFRLIYICLHFHNGKK